MRNETVAVLDVRSYEVVFFLGSKGVNDTFVFYGSHTEKYEGFSTDGFFDEDSFRRAVVAAVTYVRQNYEGVISEIYVGVPSAFISLQTKGHTISFPKKRKISRQDVDALFDSGLNELLSKNQCIRHSAMYYALGDNRKYFDEEELYGVPSTILKGALCYYFVAEKFSAIAGAVLKDLGFAPPKYLPSTLAQAQYLLSAKRREGYAFLLDVGFLTSSVSVIYGNGIVRERTFDCGLGTVIVALMQAFEVDYSVAEEILESVNVSGGVVSRDIVWTSQSGEFTIPVHNINEVVKYALDVLCENVERFFGEYYREKNTMAIAVNPISITGEGIGSVSGVAEHIAKRLNRLTETVYPDLPYYDKPTFSSRMAVLNMALSDHKTSGWFYKLFGGKKK